MSHGCYSHTCSHSYPHSYKDPYPHFQYFHKTNTLQFQNPKSLFSSIMETPSMEEHSGFWLSPLNMIHLFLICIVPISLKSVISKFISESNSFLRSLISLTNTCVINNPIVAADDDDDRYVYVHHVSMLMEKMGFPCDPEGEDEHLKRKMSLGEVSRIFEEKEPSIDELREAFDVFDCNKDGFIDALELQRVIAILGLGKGCDLESCRRMIRTFDLDGDGRIDPHEFFRFMTRNLC